MRLLAAPARALTLNPACGPSQISVHSADVKSVLRVFSVEVPAREKDDLKEEPIVAKLRKVCVQPGLYGVLDAKVSPGRRRELRRRMIRSGLGQGLLLLLGCFLSFLSQRAVPVYYAACFRTRQHAGNGKDILNKTVCLRKRRRG